MSRGRNVKMLEISKVSESSKVEVLQNDHGKTEYTFLDGYYSIRLGLTGDIEADICKLYDFYAERINDRTDAMTVKETLHEYITIFNERGLCGTEVVADKIAMVSRKSGVKKNISYLIGCMRNVLENGISSTGSYVEKRLILAFEKKYKVKLSPKGVTKLLQLSTSGSTLDVLFTVMENEIDIESMLFEKFESLLHNKGGE